MEKKQPIAPDAGSENFFQLLAIKYLPYWPFFAVLFLLSLALAFLYLQYTVPVYESSASILIKDEKKGQEDSKMVELLNLFDTKKIVENELEILRSNEVIADVVVQMKLYAPIFTESGWHGIIKRNAYLTSPVILEVSDPKSIIEVKKVYFNIASDAKSVQIAGTVFPLNEWVKTQWGTIRFISNAQYALSASSNKDQPKIKYFFSLVSVVNATDALVENLVAAPTSKQSSVITLKIKDPVPQQGEAIISNIVNSYNQNAVKKKSDIAASTLNFIEDRLRNVKFQLDSVDNSIQKYRDRTGIVDISEQSRLYLQSIAANDQQKNKMRIQMNVLDEVQHYLETKNDTSSVVPSTFEITDPSLNQLLEKLHNAQSEYARLRKTTAENNPILSSIKDEIVKTQAAVLESVKSQKANLHTSQSAVDQISNRDSAMANAIPQKEKELVEVSRQRNITAEIYTFLLQKREEAASYTMSSILPDSYLVDRATSSETPVSPKRGLIYLMALVFPFALGSSIISLKGIINNKILYRSDIEALTNYPVIGEIIEGKFQNGLITATKERSFIIEQFRLLRSAVKNLSDRPGHLGRIVFTSSIEGEGKSFIATNLANLITRNNKKVALLELDLHQPSICELLGLERGKGITDYLMGKASESEILLQTPFNPDLYFVQAGHLEEDASELLLNGKIEVLLDYLNTKVDTLIIDMPPINPITDLYVIAPLCDYTLYVIRHGKVRKNNIKMLKENMEFHNIKNVALIFNGIKKRGIGQYSYGYGYGYGYDYKSSYDSYGKARKKKTV
jgi:capsular exopolysaccharide synthesis family protein